MTSLIRCRGSALEIASIFAAIPQGDLRWRPTVWPGETVLAVILKGGTRHLVALRWGLPSTAFVAQVPRSQRGTIFARDLAARGSKLAAPLSLAHCLIVLEAFAYPGGEPGRRTRTWGGLWDEPICAWAGIWAADAEGGGCAGVLTFASRPIETVSAHMPLLLSRSACEQWLDAQAGLLSLSNPYVVSDYYLEPSDELWSTAASSE